MRFRKMRVLFAIVITSLFVSSLLSSVETKNREDAELTSSPSVDNESHKRRAGNDVGTDINNREGLLSSEDQFRVRIIESDVYGITLQFSVGNLKTYTKKASGQIYATFDSPGYGTTSEVGKPQIPVVRKMIAIPRGSEVRLSVLDAQYSSFGNGKVYPSQNPPIEGNPSDVFVIDSDFYSRDAFYPANAVEIESLGFLRDLRVALLQVNPIRFNPAKDVFEISHNIRVRLEYTVPYERSLEGTRDRRISPAFEDLYESAILNYDSIEGYLETEDRANYLIITNDSFYPSVLPLADWKRQKGLEVKVENLSNIGNSDTAIYNYIYDAYHNWELPPSYVLLVGDVEYLPTHYGLYHYYEDNYTATDLYYATVDGGDYLPDIHVGRISVKTSLEANDIISKVIGYEKDPYLAEREWYHQAVVISDYEAGRPFEDTSNYVHNFLTSQGYDVSKVYHSMGGDTSDISKNVNSGRLIVNYRGHGQRDEWYRPTFTNSDVVGLSNGRKLPIVIGPTCRSAWFDWPLGDSFGETWVKVANRGSVGYFGSSRVSYSYYNDELDKGVFWAIFDDGMRRFGQITDKAKLYMLEKFGYYGEYTHLQFEMYNVLGDPELSVWIGLPPEAEDVGTESIDSLMNKGRYLKGPHEIKATIKNYGVTLQDDFNVSAEVREIATQTVLAFTDNMENYTNPSRGGWSLLEWHRDVGNWESGAPASVGPSSAHSGSNCWGTNLDGNYDDYGVTEFAGFVVDQGTIVDVYGRNDFLDIPIQAGDHIYINISWSTGADLDLYLYKPSDVLNHSTTGGNHVAYGYSASTQYEEINYTTTLGDGSGVYSLRVNLYSGGDTSYTINEITVDNVTYTGSDYPGALKRVDDEGSGYEYPEVTYHYFWVYSDYDTYLIDYTFDYDVDLTLYDPDGSVRASNSLDNDGYWYDTYTADKSGLWRIKMTGYGPDHTKDTYTVRVEHPPHSALLASPPIDLSDSYIISARLTFWHWFDLEEVNDYAYVLVADENLQWLGGTYHTGSAAEVGWVRETMDLTPYIGYDIRVVFLLATDDSITRAGWYVDDINITVTRRIKSIIFSDDMESGGGSWTPTGFWHLVEDGVDTYNNSHSPTHSWWYGLDSTGDYDNGSVNSGSLTSSPLNLTSAVTATLSFWRWYETESGADWDLKVVQVSVNGSDWLNVSQITEDPGEWKYERIDLSSFVGDSIQIRFYFDTVDNVSNDYRGWYIDDVVVYVSTETTVFGPELRLVSAMVHNASVQVNWTYMFENTSYYRVVVTTSLPDDLDHGNDERSIVIEVVDYLPSILLVDDGWRNEEDYYRASLELNGYDYDLTYPFEDLSWYSVLQQYEIIVWATSGSLSRMEQSSLSSYLEGEGRLFISGEDIGYFLVQVGMGANFYHEYLHATYLRDDTGAVGIVGIPNDPISNGLPSLGITGYWPSEIAPRDDFSSAVFRYAGDGNASIKAYTGTHKVVYLACNFFEGPEAIATKATVMDRIIKWLRLPNQPPQITYYEPPGAPVIDEGENQRFNITAYDPDGTKPMIQWTLDGLAVGNEESYTFNTNYTSSGQHVINVTITDGQLFDYHEWVLTVNNVNRPPTIDTYSPTDNPTITEEQSQLFSITASDPDGDPVTIEWYLNGSHIENGSSYTFIADYESAGVHEVIVVVSDGNLTDSHSWLLTVVNVNRPPTIDFFYPENDPNITEEQSQLFLATASDPDGDPTTTEWYLDGGLVQNGSSYTFIADYESAGVHEVIVVVSDGNLTDSHSWLLTVVNVNRPPTIDFFYPENDPNITEEQSQLFLATASDADGDLVTIEWYLDGGFVQNGSQYAFVADYGSAGRYEVLVVVSDGYYCAYHIWNLTVADVIRPPQITSVTMVGLNLEDVKITWALSPDDPISVTHYEVYYGTVYRENMSGYQLLGVVPSGTDSYVHNQAGAGDSSSYFYYVIAVGSSNNSAPSRNQGGKFTRTLSEGPNLVSVPLVQSDENIEAVLQTVRFNKAWTYDSLGQKWRWYMSFKTHKGSLKTINHTMGVWVNVTEDCNLTAAGLVPSTGLIQLRKGWNLVSFPSFHNGYTVADVKLELGAERVEGFDPSAEPYFLRVMQDTEVLEPGIGYWINVPEDVLWNPWG